MFQKNGQTPLGPKVWRGFQNMCFSDRRFDKNRIQATEKSPSFRICMFVSSKFIYFLPKCASLHPPLFWGVGHIPVLSKVRSRISGDLLEVLPMKGSWTAHEVTLALRLHRPAPHLTLRLFVGNEPMDSDRGSWSVFKPVLCRVQFGFEKKIGECCIPLYFWLSTDISSFADVKLIWDVIPKPYQDPRRTLEQLGVTEVQFIQVDYLADQHLNEQWRALAPPDETHGVTKVVWRFEGHSKIEVL